MAKKSKNNIEKEVTDFIKYMGDPMQHSPKRKDWINFIKRLLQEREDEVREEIKKEEEQKQIELMNTLTYRMMEYEDKVRDLELKAALNSLLVRYPDDYAVIYICRISFLSDLLQQDNEKEN